MIGGGKGGYSSGSLANVCETFSMLYGTPGASVLSMVKYCRRRRDKTHRNEEYDEDREKNKKSFSFEAHGYLSIRFMANRYLQ